VKLSALGEKAGKACLSALAVLKGGRFGFTGEGESHGGA
jgi:hypothetical protein